MEKLSDEILNQVSGGKTTQDYIDAISAETGIPPQIKTNIIKVLKDNGIASARHLAKVLCMNAPGYQAIFDKILY